MTGKLDRSRDLEALRRLVDSHGADRTRWPAPERLRLAALLQNDAEARSLLAEAEALERVLDRAPVVSESRQARLVDVIMQAAIADGLGGPAGSRAGISDPRGVVVPIGAAGGSRGERSRGDVARGEGSRGDRSGRPVSLVPRNGWRVAGLLAASLLVGIFAGTLGVVPVNGMSASVAMVQVARDGEADAKLVLGSEFEVGGDGEVL